jgi:TRAP-type C4-dicarboxylate transport system permease small subunit
LSGYAIAVGAPLAFTVALIEQSHIRINLLHMRMPGGVQAVLNLVAALLLAALAVYLFVFTVRTVQETQLYGSIAQTPWATPLIYPQSIWLVSMGLFALCSVGLAIRATWLAARADWGALKREFGPETVEEELEAELSDLERR